MKKIHLLLFVVFLFAPATAQKRDQEAASRLKGIDRELEEVLDTWKAAGFAVAVVDRQDVVYAKGFGYRDLENNLPVTPNTLFAIGSSTKAFTTTILGILRNEDKLSFDESPRDYVPELKFHDPQMNELVTISDLMCHRTGLPRHDYSWYFFPSGSKDSLIRRVQYQEPFAAVREQFYYNNFMFLLQGVIAERITGMSWEDNVRQRIFEPLGMSRSNLSIEEMERSEDKAAGYELKNDQEIKKMDYYHIAGMAPAGSINSSVSDMTSWLITWINGGRFKGKEVIPPAFLTEAMSSHMVAGSGLPDKENPDLHLSNYGYGWFISSYRGHYRVEHGGNIDGFSASTCFFPSDSIGIVVLCNQNGSVVPSVVRNMAADRMLDLPVKDWNGYLKESRDKAAREEKEAELSSEQGRVEGTRTSHILLEFTGTFSNPGYGSFELVVENDSLFAVMPLNKYWLRHYHYDIFEPFEVTGSGIDTSDAPGLKFSFTTGDDGEIYSLKAPLEASVDPIEFKRTPEIIEVDKETLAKYVGEYELAGATLKVYTKRETTLYIFVQGQPEYELLPTGRHKFSFKALEGFRLEFEEDEDGNITAVNLFQPQGNYRAEKK
jgi:CubicO group peptidase (beta-lactamase class C family)